MNEADDRLRALFALDEPPARDPAFSAEVMAAVMRRELLADVAVLSGAAFVGALALWALWPVLEPTLVAMSRGLAPTAAALALAAGALAILGGRPRAALGLES
ncbi:hypothetical protein [Phenylobacterium sp.]|uniref:hypothetical protein n=1 Tax=Phenylobacterium sp. TaxID=1871053 RepID=UPI00391A0CE6